MPTWSSACCSDAASIGVSINLSAAAGPQVLFDGSRAPLMPEPESLSCASGAQPAAVPSSDTGRVDAWDPLAAPVHAWCWRCSSIAAAETRRRGEHREPCGQRAAIAPPAQAALAAEAAAAMCFFPAVAPGETGRTGLQRAAPTEERKRPLPACDPYRGRLSPQELDVCPRPGRAAGAGCAFGALPPARRCLGYRPAP